MTPDSLKWIAGWLAAAALCAPVSLGVQHLQSASQARATGAALTGGDPEAGRAAIARYGCGGCHQIQGVAGADGDAGPPLKGLARRPFVAGHLPNDPKTLAAWIRTPQEFEPGVGMPDVDLDDRQARDITAYLYTLR